jgi:hypothetical protein
MKKRITLLLLLFGLLTINAQTATSITNLQTPLVDETSGLIFYNNSLITHTDSGGEAELYEINVATGAISRTVTVSNAANVDWEDIAQDATHIYIGDIGNNSGNRTDLKVYKILKSDYNDADNMVSAEVISYSYANQTDFTANFNNNNWDAEALISYRDKLLIFTKNWANSMTNVYSIPKTSGTNSAVLEGTYNVNGLITGAGVSESGNSIFLSGYSSSAAPFIYTIHSIPVNSFDVFSGAVSPKITDIVPFGNQVEAIALFQTTPNQYKLYLSNEKFSTFVGPIPFSFPAKLWSIVIAAPVLQVPTNNEALVLTIFPNPVENLLKLSKRVDEIIIYDSSGRIIDKQCNVDEVSVENLNSGIFTAQIKVDNITIIRKIIRK